MGKIIFGFLHNKMIAVIQRVTQGSVTVENNAIGTISKGIVILLGISNNDSIKEVKKISNKIINLRIFSDDKNKMNYSLLDIEGEILLISQFTLYGNCKKGNRPSFIKAATPKHAKKIYNEFVNYIKSTSINIKQGKFGAMMEVSLINDGPVTLILNSDD